MVAWTRLVVVTTAWIMSASLACAGATPEPSAPSYFRSPSLDYVDSPRTAATNDEEVLGAHEQAAGDWLGASATSAHAAPGWSRERGRLTFDRERVAAGRGVLLGAPACAPPERGPVPPEEAKQRAAMQRAWLRAGREPSLPMLSSAAIEPPVSGPELLSCNDR